MFSSWLVFAGPTLADIIAIPVGSVTASSEIPGFNRKDDFIVDGSGLVGGQHTSAVDGNMWLSTGTAFGGDDPDPFVIFDLGAVYTISSFHVWNYNEINLPKRGVDSVTVEYGTTAGLGSTVPGISSFAVADGTTSYTGQNFSGFTPFAARFIKFDIDSNHGGDNNFYGLSEVQFDGVLSSIEVSPDSFVTSAAQGARLGTLTTVSGDAGDTFAYSLVAGSGDADNGKFQIATDELQIGAHDFSSTPDGTGFSVRVRSTGSPSGTQVERSLLVTAMADSDADGLLDVWEETWAGVGNLGVLSGLGGANEDGDGLTDLEEYTLRDQFPNLDPTEADTDGDNLNDDLEIAGADQRPPTDPTLADTDGDSLDDDVETNTGIFAGADDTGTDPTEADSDGDTLSDGVETDTGIFVGPTDTGSDPNLADTDDDDFNDNVEVTGGSNPSDPNSVPPTPPVGLDRKASSPDAVVVFNEVHFNPLGAAETGEWIELFNQMGIVTDISGWRLDGVGYIFPEGTIIDPGDYLVVAKSPISGQLGPFPGNLDNGGERLRLINKGDRLMDELDYGDDGRWPAAADGSGATLAKRRPYSANAPVENWAASEQLGGTPGAENFPAGIAAPGLVINELPAATEPSFWVELKNTGSSPVQLAGVTLSAAGDPLREYMLPAGTLAADARLLIDEATLGFHPADGEKLFLYNAGETAVLDGRELTGRNRGRASSRGAAWLYPSVPTPGAANAFVFNEDIVISEIAYNPPALIATPATPATYGDVELLAYNVHWRYNDGDENLPADWADEAHALGGNWKIGGAPIGKENSTLPVPLVTNLSPYSTATITYYFEREFDLTTQQLADIESLEITHQIDDGAVFYLNGVEVGERFNIAAGAVGPETTASPSVGAAGLTTIPIPIGSLVSGSNRLSVEVHQANIGSSDLVFGLKLDARLQLTPPVPGTPFRNSDNQWLEIANRGTAPVDLSGWDFGDGISFDFADGTMLAAGEHACIARDAIEFAAAFPAARLLGEFGGSLSRSGERLLLRDAGKNPADELHYFDGGRWPETADGGGASLELRDLDADNAIAESWAASDESGQAAWRTYTYRGTATAADVGPTRWKEFNIGLLDSGEILLDDISVVEDPDGAATPLLSNGDFTAGTADWRLRGNQRHSEVVADPDDGANQVLRLVATSTTEHMHNQLETTLAGGQAVDSGTEYEISFRARWVAGTPLFHTRLYFARVALAHTIDRPQHVGTPSAANSTAQANIGPSVADMLHSPAVPAALEAVTVSARAADPDGVSGMTLKYSVAGAAFQSVAMTAAGDGGYQGTIPGQAAAAVVQFYIEAADGLGAMSTFPARGPDSRALIKVDDGLAASNGLHNFRIILTDADRDLMYSNTEVMSNDRAGATIIDREEEIYYDARVRLKGSQRARAYQPRVGFNMRFGSDQPYRGIHQSMAIDRSEGVGSGQYELLFDLMMANSGGVISRYYDLIQVITPTGATHTRPAVLQMARYDDVFLNSQFEDGGDGKLYEYDFVYYPQSTDNGQETGNKVPQGDGISGLSIADHGDDKEVYRFYLLKKNNRDDDDFDSIIAYCQQMSKSGAAFSDTLDQVVDVDSWLRGMAYGVLSGAGDNTAAGTGHNGMYYARTDGRIIYFPHDMDFSFSNTRSVFANGECGKLANTASNPGNAQRKRIYFGHLHDIISTTWNEGYMGMWQTHLAQLSPTQNWISPNSGTYTIGARSANVLSQINGGIPEVAFGITTPSPLVVASSSATVSGDGWVNVRELRVAGAPEPLAVTWTDGDSWQVTLPVAPGSQSYTLQAFDFSGELIGGEAITIENTTPVEPASAANLAISELMYHPADPTAGEIGAGFTDADLFEYVELTNIGAAAIDLSGVAFTAGITHALPSTIVAPGERAVLARDRAAFLTRHPGAAGVLLDGEYIGPDDSNQFSNGGEQVVLAAALGADIRRFSYDDDLPWPEAADGSGPSLVLIAPESNPDHALPSSWRQSTAAGGSPGGSDATTFAGTAGADVDGNGLDDLLDYALGHAPGERGGLPSPQLDEGAMLISYSRNLAADDVILSLESSGELQSWSQAAAVQVSSTDQGGGVVIETWQLPAGAGDLRLFVRAVVVER